MKSSRMSINGNTSFVQYDRPALDSGDYRLTLRQSINIEGAVVDTLGEDVYFAVAGERFSIAAAEIISVFPPQDSQGDFARVLPHIAFTRSTLPWERLCADPQQQLDAPPVGSWLAVLVFNAAAIAAPGSATLLRYSQGTLSDLQTPPTGTVSYPNLKALQYGETPEDPCSFIDVNFSLFQQVVPSLQDLQWNAHVRTIDNNATCARLDSAAVSNSRSVVFANRFPSQGARSLAYLVSLEGLADYLPGAAVEAPRLASDTIRLAVLKSWSFDCLTTEKVTFGQVVKKLNPGVFRLPGLEAAGLQAVDPVAKRVRDAAWMGYVGLKHELRGGDHTVSWYRGPFVTYPVPLTLAQHMPLTSADAISSYDPSTGLLDVSYSAAWQLGKMLALASPAFSTDLLAWKRSLQQSAITQWERSFFQQQINPDQDLPATVSIDARLQLKRLLQTDRPVELGPTPTRSRRAVTRPRPAEVLSQAMAQLFAAQAAPPMPGALIDWLEALRKLHTVPFVYLVPYSNVLPAESIRFFHLDGNWTDCLVDGALSLGGADSTASHNWHATLRHALPAALRANPPQPVTGFLLRSKAIGWWPGLQCSAYAAGVPLTNLRFDKLSADTVLCLVSGIADTFDLHQPAEGVHFGVDVQAGAANVDPSAFSKKLRTPENGLPCSLAIETLSTFYRPAAADGGAPVLKLDQLKARMEKMLVPAFASAFTAAEFALEMVEGVDLVSFNLDISTEAASHV